MNTNELLTQIHAAIILDPAEAANRAARKERAVAALHQLRNQDLIVTQQDIAGAPNPDNSMQVEEPQAILNAGSDKDKAAAALRAYTGQ